MKLQRVLKRSLAVLTMGWLLCPNAQAASAIDVVAQSRPQESKYRSPDDLITMIPFLGDIPRTFLFGDGYKMKLGTQDLRIDHMGYRSRSAAARRNCLLGISYTRPVAGFFTSRIDIPVMNSPTLALHDWGRSSFGDYVAYFSRGAVESTSVRLVLTAKF